VPKIRVFKTPSKKNTTEVYIGIPDSIQTDPDITAIALTQVEVLSPPKRLQDLFRVAEEKINTPVNAMKSVQASVLEPGFKFKAVPKGSAPWFFNKMRPLEVEEVVIPKGYVHLDDFSDWEIFNYNRSYHLTDRDFKPLPEEKRLPIKHRYHLIRKGKEFKAIYDRQIDYLIVHYRRISKFSQDYEWVKWTKMKREDEEPHVWLPQGEYIFRAVPYFLDKPMDGYKEFHAFYEEDETLKWTAVQTSKEVFQIRMEGQLGDKINYLEVWENGNILIRKKLNVDKEGRIEEVFRVKGVSDDKHPRLEYRFYRKQGAFKSYRTNSYHNLERHYADEPIGFLVKKISNTKFLINIQDPKELLYSPISAIDPFSGQQWNTAIQSGKLICKLLINRHQDGEVRPYGSYFVNTTSEKATQFIDKPPFGSKVEKVSKGIEFEFEDTQLFRQIMNLDNPDIGKKLSYEFRLSFWSAGIEETIRSGDSYSFIKETPVIIKNKRRAYKYNYNTWKEEHPRRKYTGIIPVDVEYKHLGHHLRYGTCPDAYVLTAEKVPVKRTRNILMTPLEWKVLYYYNDKEDEIQEFPYYMYDIKVPATSMLEIEKLEVFVDNELKNDVSLGVFHTSEKIEIIDFLVYFEARKLITKKIPLRKVLAPLRKLIMPKTGLLSNLRPSPAPSRSILAPSANRQASMTSNISIANSAPARSSVAGRQSQSRTSFKSRKFGHFKNSNSIISEPSIGGLPSMRTNTIAKKLEAKTSNSRINNSISRVVESGTIKYRVDIHYKDGKMSTETIAVEISSRPKLPPEPPDNSSVTVGNKTFIASTVQLPSGATSTVQVAISQIPMSKKSNFSQTKKSTVTGTSRAKSFGGFKR